MSKETKVRRHTRKTKKGRTAVKEYTKKYGKKAAVRVNKDLQLSRRGTRVYSAGVKKANRALDRVEEQAVRRIER
ncbi:MAG: hypothetical protein ACTSRR_09630 [Candidatus Heimdallarchaeaceae archaeon]